jgi:hypothetical protein
MATGAGPRDPWWQWTLLVACIAGFVALVLPLPTGQSSKISETSLPWFWALALLPGITGIANYLVTSQQRDADTTTPTEAMTSPPETSKPAKGKKKEDQHRPKFRQTLAAATVLTAVFCIVARAAGHENLDGLVYAGYGTYISTVWFMLVRLNANALSPRFMVNSTLKAGIALMIGYVASKTDVVTQFGTIVNLPAMYFLAGLFHSWAMKALRRTAMATFGVKQASAADLPVRLLEGVDDDAVDVLEELGITSVQHMATMHAPEICGRSLYPRNRVLDWIDQSILIMHTNGRINELRALGIRSAYALITVARHAFDECACGQTKDAAHDRLKQAGERLGLSIPGMYLVKTCIETDPAYLALKREYPEWHQESGASAYDA